MSSFEKLKNMLLARERFLVIGHKQPDGDAVGALLAFAEVLKVLKKDYSLVTRDPIPEVFSFLPGSDQISRDFLLGEFDCIVLLDNGDLKRTGFDERIRQAKQRRIPIINIDHHIRNDIWKMANINYVDEESPATSLILYKIIRELKIAITPSLATCLLAGIYNDTGGFHHTNTSGEVLSVVADLLSHGGKLRQISEKVSNTRSMPRLKLWGIALNNIIYNRNYNIVASVLTRDDIKKADASEDDVTGLTNLLSSASEAHTAMLLYETESGKIKGSLRTENSKIDVAELANCFGGGGHKRAAGFSLEGKLRRDKEGEWFVE